MPILEEKPISLSEVYNEVKNRDSETFNEIQSFLKEFVKLDLDKSNELNEELKNLNILKLKDKHIIKIIDFLPSDSSELNKVLDDISLNEDEIKRILDVVGKY